MYCTFFSTSNCIYLYDLLSDESHPKLWDSIWGMHPSKIMELDTSQTFFFFFWKSLLYSSPPKLLCIVFSTGLELVTFLELDTAPGHCLLSRMETQMLGFSSPQRTLTLTHSYCVSWSTSLLSSALLYLSDLVWSGAAVSTGRSETT